MPCLPTKCLSLLLVAVLAACGSPANTPKPHAYVQTISLKEKLATQQLATANYQQALQTFSIIYRQYLQLDDHNNMARLLVNQFQTALIIEDLATATAAQNQLQALLARHQHSAYQQRLNLLSANLAMLQQNWASAEQLLAAIPASAPATTYLAAQLNLAIVAFEQGQPVASLRQLQQTTSAYPALAARLARLQASIALTEGNTTRAADYTQRAKMYYQGSHFPPGVAECLLLEAKLHTIHGNTSQATLLKQQAKTIFLTLGNSHAVSRHQL